MINKPFIATIFLIAVSMYTLKAQNTYIPDDNFEQALIDLGYDTGPLNDSVPTDSINTITDLNISGKGIGDLTGIEAFIHLSELNISNNAIANVDLAFNTKLVELVCYNNKLETLQLGANPLIETINCSNNELSTLDFSTNTALKYLNCSNNLLRSLNLKNGNNNLLTGDSYQVTGLDTRNNSKLFCLQVDAPEAALNYETWFRDKWTEYTTDCGTYEVKMTYVPDDNFEQRLVDLGLDYGELNDSVPTFSIKQLDFLDLSYRNISDLTGIENFQELKTLYCRDNQLKTINLQYNSQLNYLDISGNKLSSLNLNSNPLVTYVKCSNNQIIDLDLSNNTFLTSLICSINKLTGLNVRNGNNANLFLYVAENPDLFCIQVDDITTAESKNWNKNSYTAYSEDCSNHKPEMTYVPDDNFEQRLIDLGLDYGELNDSVPTVGIMSHSTLYLDNRNISDLTGIEAFEELKYLYCQNNKLTELNISQNTKLQELNCDNNQIIELDLSANTFLTSFDARNNQLTGLNLKNGNNTNMEVNVTYNGDLLCIEVDDPEATYEYSNWQKNAYTAYTEDCSNYIMEMTFVPDDNFEQALINLKLDYQESLNDSVPTIALKELTRLYVNNRSINDLTGIEDCKRLITLNCSSNNIEFIDLSENTEIMRLYCERNSLNTLSLSTNTKLRELTCRYNNIEELDLSANIELERIYCNNNQLKKLNIQNNNNALLSGLNAQRNLSLCILVDDIDLASSKTGWYIDDWAQYSIDCSNHTVEMVYVPDDNFEQALIDLGYDSGSLNDSVCKTIVGNITDLSTLYRKNIKSLEGIEEFTSLTKLSCKDNLLTKIDVSSNVNLTYFDCSDNSLDSLNLSNNTELITLICENNQLTSLNVTPCVKLTNFWCSENRLQSIDLSNNSYLENFRCWYNDLTQLDISHNPLLKYLSCGGNKITSLDVSSNKNLVQLDVYNSDLYSLNLQNGNNENLALSVKGNPNLTCIQVDDETAAGNYSNWYKDEHASYSENCNSQSAGISSEEYNALVDLYNSTVGPNWKNSNNWLDTTNVSVADWYGVTVNNGHVTEILLNENNLQESFYSDRFNLPYLKKLELSGNMLDGFDFYALDSLTHLDTLLITNNKLIFNDLIPAFELHSYPNFSEHFYYQEQQKISSQEEVLVNVGEYYSLYIEGEFISPYDKIQWFKEGEPIEGAVFDTLTFPGGISLSDSGAYHVEITNPQVPELTLKSHYKVINPAYTQETKGAGIPLTEYKALEALYNQCGGKNWIWSENWLDTINHQVNDWQGVVVENNHVIELFRDSIGITGQLPIELLNLTQLKYLWLGANNIPSLPEWIGDLSSLEVIEIYGGSFAGQLPSSIGQLKNLTRLVITHNNIEGSIPEEIGSLENLVDLWLYNNKLSGNIPESIGKLKKLEALGLQNNNISGVIPSSIGDCTSLNSVYLANNEIIGPLPTELEQLSNLVYFNIDGNNIGWIDSALKSVNNENRQIPDELSELLEVDTLHLAHNKLQFNDIEAIFSWENFSSIKSFSYKPQGNIGKKQHIQAEVGSQVNLEVDGYFAGNSDSYAWYKNDEYIPGSNKRVLELEQISEEDAGVYEFVVFNSVAKDLILRSELITITVSQTVAGAGVPKAEYEALVDFYNALDGANWEENENWLDTINASVNDWFGVTVENGHVTQVVFDAYTKNKLKGELPHSIHLLKYLKKLYLITEDVSGTIPDELYQLENLEELIMAECSLHGELSADIQNLSKLKRLSLEANELSGNIPEELGSLQKLEMIALYENQFGGEIPASIGELSELSYFAISNNKVGGEIPVELGNLSKIRYLLLDNNMLSGAIPAEFQNLKELVIFTINDNQIGYETDSTKSIAISANTSERKIPDVLSGLIDLDTFKIAGNNIQFNDIEAIFSWENFNQINEFIYHPQAKIGNEKSITDTLGTNIVLRIDNYYQGEADKITWFKDGEQLSSDNYPLIISNASIQDAGKYHCTIKNATAVLLQLESHPISVNLIDKPAEAGVPVSEYKALEEFYDHIGTPALNNWLDTLSGTVNDWQGVKVENGRVVAIDLSNMSIIGDVFDIFSAFDSLRWLNLSNNQLSGIIPTFNGTKSSTTRSVAANAHKLSYLNISNNNFVFSDLEPTADELLAIDTFIYAPQSKIGSTTDTAVYKYETHTIAIETYVEGENDSYLWYKGDSTVAQTLAYNIDNTALNDSGNYVLEVENSVFPDLKLTSENYKLTVMIPVGIKDFGLKEIRIFPVPARDRIYIDIASKTLKLELMDMAGHVVFTENNFTSSWLPIQSYPKGIYFIRLSNEKSQSVSKKILIK